MNRRKTRDEIKKNRTRLGLQSQKGNGGSRDLIEIADIEDECKIKIKDIAITNQHRSNKLLTDGKANAQTNKI